MTLVASVGETVQIQFPAFDVDGLTPMSGLVDGDFGKVLFVDDSASAETVTVTEIASTGYYVVEFVPTGDGLWYVEVQTPVDDVFGDQVHVGAAPTDWAESVAGEGATFYFSIPKDLES